MTQPEST